MVYLTSRAFKDSRFQNQEKTAIQTTKKAVWQLPCLSCYIQKKLTSYLRHQITSC